MDLVSSKVEPETQIFRIFFYLPFIMKIVLWELKYGYNLSIYCVEQGKNKKW